MTRSALQVSGLTAGRVLDKVGFDVAPEQFVSLLGPSGVGKTTILRHIAGLERAQGGAIRIGGRLVSCADPEVHVPPQDRGIGVVFQSYALWPHLSVFENLAFPLRVRRRPEPEIRRRVGETLRFLRLEGLELRRPSQISGGQQQRVALGRALIYDAKLVLLDEPLANVDPRAREEIAADLRQTLKAAGATVLYVTHDQQEAVAVSDRIILLHEGRVVQEGTPDELFLHPRERAAAEFFGASNVIEGVLEKGAARLAGAVIPWSGGGLAEGARVAAFLRYRDLELSRAAGPKPETAWGGRVAEVRFAWESERVVVDAGGLKLTVHAERGAWKAGDPVVVSVRPGRLRLFPV